MITDILKQKTDKPRFFLHDEVKAWLGDNLRVNIRVAPNYSANWDLQNKLQNYGWYNPITVGFAMETTISVNEEIIQMQGSNTLMLENESLTTMMIKRFESYDAHIQHLEATNQMLQRRIETLEKLSAT